MPHAVHATENTIRITRHTNCRMFFFLFSSVIPWSVFSPLVRVSYRRVSRMLNASTRSENVNYQKNAGQTLSGVASGVCSSVHAFQQSECIKYLEKHTRASTQHCSRHESKLVHRSFASHSFLFVLFGLSNVSYVRIYVGICWCCRCT